MAVKTDPIVLVPHYESIAPETDECLRGVEKLGIEVWRYPYCSAIDWARSEMASTALIDGREAILFIDADMVFLPSDVPYILGRPEPLVGGLYVQKGFRRKINAMLDASVEQIPCGTGGTDFPAKAIGTGFLRITRQCLLDLIEQSDPPMPCCTFHGGRVWPFFLPMVVQRDDLQWAYLGEDYSFCLRCTQIGIVPILDTRIRLYHRGPYNFGWEDAARAEPSRDHGMILEHRVR